MIFYSRECSSADQNVSGRRFLVTHHISRSLENCLISSLYALRAREYRVYATKTSIERDVHVQITP